MIRSATIVVVFTFLFSGNLLAADESLSSLQYDPFEQPTFLKIISKIPGSESVTSELTIELRSIIEAGDESMVNVNGAILNIGDTYEDYELVTVGNRDATFIKDGENIIIKMKN